MSLSEAAIKMAIEHTTEYMADKVWNVGKDVLKSFRQDTKNTHARSVLQKDIEGLEKVCEVARKSKDPTVQTALQSLETELSAVQNFMANCCQERTFFQRMWGMAKDIVHDGTDVVYDGTLHAEEIIEAFHLNIQKQLACLDPSIATTYAVEVSTLCPQPYTLSPQHQTPKTKPSRPYLKP